MKKELLIILLFTLTIISCDNYNLKIDSEFRTVLNSYQINETIYFQSEQNPTEFDTIWIKQIDSIRQYPKIGTVPPMKEIYLRIEHLPIDNWKEEKIAGTNEKRKNQPMITVSNIFEKCCQITLKLREFESSIKKESFDMTNKIDTLKRNSPIKIKDDYIIELYWSNESGILGYKKDNGQIYRRKTQHNKELR